MFIQPLAETLYLLLEEQLLRMETDWKLIQYSETAPVSLFSIENGLLYSIPAST